MSVETNKHLGEAFGLCWHTPAIEVGQPYPCRDNMSMQACDYEITCTKCGDVLSQGDDDSFEKATKSAQSDLDYLLKGAGRPKDTSFIKDRRWPEFTSGEGYLKLVELCKQQVWWPKFLQETLAEAQQKNSMDVFTPEAFASHVSMWIKLNTLEV